ncbi:major allergen Pru ar 1 [Ricinus communis]|uniref:major allergen Pru ar 1 n=1 Tax=Ricinus communis TaxID=3988 RepID=UPI000772719D|nr:major allergen Pru ar 1 [Ricinus communis]|eukprot:XP_015573307.1 major allergen Pru ar 1 [Ricinus communis]
MGVFTYSDEYTSPVPPARLFKALILDSNNLIPKLMPQIVKSIEFVQGDGGVGSIKQINFQEGHQLKYVKNRIDAIDPENWSYTYSLVEGDGLLDKLESVVYQVQFLPGQDGGSINKMKSTYNTKGDIVLGEEQVKAGKEKALGMYKVVEGYLLQNPDAYA